jgi:Asp/Glu/hydantoin racemase
MRLVAIPPYRNPAVNWGWVLRHLVEDYRKTGALQGVEIDVDDGYLVDSTNEKRDEEVLAVINVGIVNKVKEYAQTGKYDGIVLTGGIDPGFIAARVVLQDKLPVTGAIHAALHVASLIGERVSEIHTVPSSSLIVRHLAQRYGFGDKLVAVRIPGITSTAVYRLLEKYRDNWGGRLADAGLGKIMDEFTAECVAAIEENRADSLILACEHLQVCADGIRQRLDRAGYHEIPLVRALPAGIEMAIAMANMKLLQTARAYPGHALKAAPQDC